MPLSAMRLFLCGVAAACVSAARPAWCPETVTSVTQVRAVCIKGYGEASVSLQTGNYSCLGTDCEGIFHPPACPERPPLSSYSCDALRHICADLNSRLELADTNSSTGGQYVCGGQYACIGDSEPLAHPPKSKNLLPAGERGWVIFLSFLVCVAFACAGGYSHHQLNREQAEAARLLPSLGSKPPKVAPRNEFIDYVRQHHCWLSLKHGDPQVISLLNRRLIELSCGAFALGTAVLCTGATAKQTAQSSCELTLSSQDSTIGFLKNESDYPNAALWVVAVIMPVLWGVATHTLVSAATRTRMAGAAIAVTLVACSLFVAVAFYALYHHIGDRYTQTYLQKELTYLSVFVIAYLFRCAVVEPVVLLCVFKTTPRVYLSSASDGSAPVRMREVTPLVADA